MGRPCSQNGSRYECFQILIGKHTAKRLLGGTKRRLEDNIRMNLKEMGVNTRNWVDSAQDREYGEPL